MLQRLPGHLRRKGQGKKLTEAARLLARGELHVSHDDDAAEPQQDDLDDALAAFGLRLEGATSQSERVFYLWPEHQAVLGLWFAVQTQWRVGPMGPTGLDYTAVEAAIRMGRHAPQRRVRERLAELQIMERAALAEWAQDRQRRTAR